MKTPKSFSNKTVFLKRLLESRVGFYATRDVEVANSKASFFPISAFLATLFYNMLQPNMKHTLLKKRGQ